MTLFRPEIIVFEDRPERYDEIESSLSDNLNELDSDIDFDQFPPTPDLDPSDILSGLKDKLCDPKPPILVVCDYDLTASEHVVKRQDVREACNEEDIPLCIYHRRDGEVDISKKFEEYEEDIIKVNPSEGLWKVGHECAIIADGFWSLQNDALEVFSSEEDEETDQDPTPLIPEMLGAPDNVRGKLDQYAWGNPEPLFGGSHDDLGEEDTEEMLRRWITSVGYWIMNELLVFPGALLNLTAVAAYLDVDHRKMREEQQYQDELDSAIYEGPFAKLDKWYWLPRIDQIRADQMTEEDTELPLGSTIFERMGLPEIGHSVCFDAEHGDHPGARYYCPILDAPVCKEHSRSPGGWIPMGATRTRVSETEYNKIAPWML